MRVAKTCRKVTDDGKKRNGSRPSGRQMVRDRWQCMINGRAEALRSSAGKLWVVTWTGSALPYNRANQSTKNLKRVLGKRRGGCIGNSSYGGPPARPSRFDAGNWGAFKCHVGLCRLGKGVRRVQGMCGQRECRVCADSGSAGYVVFLFAFSAPASHGLLTGSIYAVGFMLIYKIGLAWCDDSIAPCRVRTWEVTQALSHVYLTPLFSVVSFSFQVNIEPLKSVLSPNSFKLPRPYTLWLPKLVMAPCQMGQHVMQPLRNLSHSAWNVARSMYDPTNAETADADQNSELNW